MPREFFVLRSEHDQAFEEAGIMRFQKRAIRWLTKDFSACQALPKADQLLTLLKKWTSLIRPNGLLTEKQMYAFFGAGLKLQLLGHDIASNSKVYTILRSNSLPDKKVDDILRLVASSQTKISTLR